jgi:hypothetical protein
VKLNAKVAKKIDGHNQGTGGLSHFGFKAKEIRVRKGLDRATARLPGRGEESEGKSYSGCQKLTTNEKIRRKRVQAPRRNSSTVALETRLGSLAGFDAPTPPLPSTRGLSLTALPQKSVAGRGFADCRLSDF